MSQVPLKISVITVCYNSEETIEQALRSVQYQVYPYIEHIVIDGGSKDATCEIIERNQSRIAIWLSEPDRGIYDAMNKGVARATGDVVVFLNADDFYPSPSVLSEIAALLEEHGLDAVMGDVAFFMQESPQKIVRRYRSGGFSINRMRCGWMPAHPGLFLRRRLIEEAGGFKADYKIAGDFELILRIFKNNNLKFKHFPKPVVMMQLGGISTSGWRARWRSNQEILRACSENDLKTSLVRLFLRYPQKIMEKIFVRWDN